MRYISRDETPLKFHNFFRFVALPIGILYTIYNMYNEFKNVSQLDLLYTFDLLILSALIVLNTLAFIGFFKWKSYAWYCVMARTAIMIINSAVIIYICMRYNTPAATRLIVQQVLSLAVTGLITAYYYKRKLLFFEQKQNIPQYTHPIGEGTTNLHSPYQNPENTTATDDIQINAGKLSVQQFCSNCGAALNPGHRFCPKCGAEIK